jgi:hypothetical protein
VPILYLARDLSLSLSLSLTHSGLLIQSLLPSKKRRGKEIPPQRAQQEKKRKRNLSPKKSLLPSKKERKQNLSPINPARKEKEVSLKRSLSPLQEKIRKMKTLLKGPSKKRKQKEISLQRKESIKNFVLFAEILIIYMVLAHAFIPRDVIVPHEFYSLIYTYFVINLSIQCLSLLVFCFAF